jgi:hypothetical protein
MYTESIDSNSTEPLVVVVIGLGNPKWRFEQFETWMRLFMKGILERFIGKG